MDLRNTETLQHAFLICFFAGVVIYFVLYYFLKYMGVDIYSKKWSCILLTIGFAPVLILLWVIPYGSLKIKFIASIAGLFVVFIYYFTLDKTAKNIRKKLGIKTAEDRIQKQEQEEKKDDK